MKQIVFNTYILFMLLAYVMHRAGTFSMEEKVKMIELLGYMAANPDSRIEECEGAATLLEKVKRHQPSRVAHLEAQSRASKSLECNPHL